MTERFERFSFALLEIYHHWHTIAAEEMKAWGLKVPHALLLLAMQHFESGITAAQLTALCGRDKSEVSRSIALLEKKGMLTRVEVGQSQYRALIYLTDSGKHVAQALRARAELAVTLGGRGITDEQRAAFYETLELIAYNLQTLTENGLPESAPKA